MLFNLQHVQKALALQKRNLMMMTNVKLLIPMTRRGQLVRNGQRRRRRRMKRKRRRKRRRSRHPLKAMSILMRRRGREQTKLLNKRTAAPPRKSLNQVRLEVGGVGWGGAVFIVLLLLGWHGTFLMR